MGERGLTADGIKLDIVSEVVPFLRKLDMVSVTADKPGPGQRYLLGHQLHQARIQINGAACHASFDPSHQFKIVSDQRSRSRKLWIIQPLTVSVQNGPLTIAESIRDKVKSSYGHHERDRVRLAHSLTDQVGEEKADEMLAAINLQYKMLQRTMSGIADNVQSLCDHLIKYEKKIELPSPVERRNH